MLEFDESYYLEKNPDVAEAVRNGEWPSGFTHFCVTGKQKGRIGAPPLDVEWYVSTYPQAAREIAAGTVANAGEHYHRLGKFRGYLPSADAARPANPAATASRFGGLWTDVGNALDLVGGRETLGMIDAEQGKLLCRWITEGFVILPGAIPETVLEQSRAELRRAFQGEMPGALFDPPEAAVAGAGEVLDIHWDSEPIRRLIFSPAILGFLHLLFERQVLASQVHGRWLGAVRELHQDSASIDYSLPLQFAAAWIALDDVRGDAGGDGGLYYYPGSHRLADFRYGSSKSDAEALRLKPEIDLAANRVRHRELLARQIAGLGLERQFFRARRGDVLIAHADLAQGEVAGAAGSTLMSVRAHYCPVESAPGYSERAAHGEVRPFGAAAFYSSAHHRS